MTRKQAIFILLGLGILCRIASWFAYTWSVSIFNDTETYTLLAQKIIDGALIGYNGERTPMYPLIIVLSGLNLHLVVLIQCIFGLLSSYFVFDSTSRITSNLKVGLAAGVVFTSFLNIIFFEFSILSETLSLFLFTCVVWLYIRFEFYKGIFSLKGSIYLSLSLAALFLTRPFFLYFSLVISGTVFLRYILTRWKFSVLHATVILLPTMLCFLSWSSLNYKNTGAFVVTSYYGINLSQATMPFFEKAPDEHRLIRDIYVAHRDTMLANEEDAAMAIWRALPELEEKTGKDLPQLSAELASISRNLIKEHPIDYLKLSARSWVLFWRSSFYMVPENFRNSNWRTAFDNFWSLQRKGVVLAHICLLCGFLLLIYKVFKQKAHFFDPLFLIAISVVLASVAQALVTYGNNSRFAVPFFGAVLVFAFVFIFRMYTFFRQKRKTIKKGSGS
ncbi:hypothetical protein [Flavimarina sp. Hel_I_48]|uniref:hypothetical protein n=1 Tax=Flavimarina sp. Hel_I_48 TaxID=1392488 RepID=UPI0004DEDA5D|nr:hypothetical protein [Flavimarina sp. Hel_I_48]